MRLDRLFSEVWGVVRFEERGIFEILVGFYGVVVLVFVRFCFGFKLGVG